MGGEGHCCWVGPRVRGLGPVVALVVVEGGSHTRCRQVTWRNVHRVGTAYVRLCSVAQLMKMSVEGQ